MPAKTRDEVAPAPRTSLRMSGYTRSMAAMTVSLPEPPRQPLEHPVSVVVKARAGNKSAQLVQSKPVKVGRKTRMVPMCIGSVSAGANLDTGVGLRFNPGYGLDSLDAADRQKVQAWLATAASGDAVAGAKVTLADLAGKLDELLRLAQASAATPVATADNTVAAPAPVMAASISPAASEMAAFVEGALDRLEGALAAAVSDLTRQVNAAKTAGATLTNQRHAQAEPAGKTSLDLLQARANYLRGTVLPQFEQSCKALGLMVSRTGRNGD